MEFHERLTAMMDERGITQSDLARRLGVTRTATHNWCWGVNEPSITTLSRIRRLLRCEWDDLLGR